MCGEFLQITGYIDDSDGLKWTFLFVKITIEIKLFSHSSFTFFWVYLLYLYTNTTTNTQFLGKRSLLGGWSNLYTEFTHAHHWTRLLTFLAATFRFTFIITDDGDTDQFVRLFVILATTHYFTIQFNQKNNKENFMIMKYF